MVEFLSEQQENMTDQAIAIKTAISIFNECYQVGFDQDRCAELILEAIRRAKR
jgi:hypothetical protein